MLEHFLQPVRPELLHSATAGIENIGETLLTELPNDRGPKTVAIISSNFKFGSTIRLPFYRLANVFKGTNIADLGDFRNANPEFMAAPLETIMEAGVIPVILAGNTVDAINLLQMLKSRDEEGTWNNSVICHESVDFDISGIADQGLTFIGAQSHLLTKTSDDALRNKGVVSHRLSQVRDQMDEIEPAIRDANFLNFDLSVMRSSDLPGQNSRSTSGFFTEEGCKLLRYAGMSPKLRCIVFTGADASAPRDFQTANTLAQLLWYYISGFHQLVREDPASQERFTRYVVNLPGHDFDLTFAKSDTSGRWWLKVPHSSGTKHMSCSYNDYLAACENIVTERVIAAVTESMDVVKD